MIINHTGIYMYILRYSAGGATGAFSSFDP